MPQTDFKMPLKNGRARNLQGAEVATLRSMVVVVSDPPGTPPVLSLVSLGWEAMQLVPRPCQKSSAGRTIGTMHRSMIAEEFLLAGIAKDSRIDSIQNSGL